MSNEITEQKAPQQQKQQPKAPKKKSYAEIMAERDSRLQNSLERYVANKDGKDARVMTFYEALRPMVNKVELLQQIHISLADRTIRVARSSNVKQMQDMAISMQSLNDKIKSITDDIDSLCEQYLDQGIGPRWAVESFKKRIKSTQENKESQE